MEILGAVVTVCLALSPAIALDDRERSAMFSEAQNVWKPHGVTVRPGQADDCDRLLVVKSDAEARPEDIAHDSALGWVRFVGGKARRLVFLRVSRAQSLIGAMSPGTRPEALTRLLVLNSPQHRERGLMRAHYRERDVLSLPISSYTLDAARHDHRRWLKPPG